MRRFLGKFSFLVAVALVAGFAYGTYALSDPVDRVQKDVLVRGAVRPAAALRADAPFISYVAVHAGPPSRARTPETLVDDEQTEDDGSFELVADPSDGSRFYVLAQVETAREDFWCEIVELPPVRHRDDGTWVEVGTGRPLAPVRITVDRSRRCGP